MEATMEKIEVEELRQNGRQWLAGLTNMDRIWLDLEAASRCENGIKMRL